MRYFYNFILYLSLPFLLWHRAFRRGIKQRLGQYNFAAFKSTIWVHAASMGEVNAAVLLIKMLQKKYPEITIVLTVMTPTGVECAHRNLGDSVVQLYMPYDLPYFVKKFLRQFNPQILLLMETELWPNMLHYTAQKDVPIMVVSARLGKKSFARYQKMHKLVKPMLNALTVVAAQSREDQERFISLGMSKEKVILTGNIKFDLTIAAEIIARGQALKKMWGENRFILVAGSTHPGEEEKILAALQIMRSEIPEILLVLVPRYPENFNAVFSLIGANNFSVQRFSASDHQPLPFNTEVLLGDVIGQLLSFYVAGDIAFVGGSLVAFVGGHNLLEPAAVGKPIISGPHLAAFSEVKEKLQERQALIIVNDAKELASKIIEIFHHKSLANNLASAALEVVTQNCGATQRIVKLVETIIKNSTHR